MEMEGRVVGRVQLSSRAAGGGYGAALELQVGQRYRGRLGRGGCIMGGLGGGGVSWEALEGGGYQGSLWR